MARTTTCFRLNEEERGLLEKLRQERRARSWSEVVRALLREAVEVKHGEGSASGGGEP